jgi:hypothetical protein
MNTYYRHTTPPGSSDALEPNPVTRWDWTRLYLRRVLRWALPIAAAGAWVWLCLQAGFDENDVTSLQVCGSVAVVVSAFSAAVWVLHAYVPNPAWPDLGARYIRAVVRGIARVLACVLAWPWREDRLERTT